MRIFIVGAGEVGLHIATSLVKEGHDLVVIERAPEKVAQLHGTMDVLAVAGDGCNPEILRKNGIQDADLYFAVSNDDSANLLGALTAKAMGAERCVVRVGAAYHRFNPLLKGKSDIVQLYPERLVAEEIVGLTRVPGVSKVRYFSDGRLAMLQARPSTRADIYDRPLQELDDPSDWVLTGISRHGELIIPRGDTVLRPGEPIYAVGRTETIPRFLESIGVSSTPTRKVVIAGAGQVGTWLAKLLCKEKIQATVVQRGEARAFDLAAEVKDALVLRGDATDPAMLREAGVKDSDYFVAATQDDETNILSSLLARELGARSVVTLYHRPEFLSVLNAVRIDLPLSPRIMIAGTILRMVHRREILSMDLVEGGDAEVVEFEVREHAAVLKRQLKDLNFPRDAIVGAVTRGNETVVPSGNFKFHKGDQTLIFTLSHALPELERIFRGK